MLVKDDSVYTSTERGIKPLMRWLDDEIDLGSYSAADKIVGKAAAFLYVLLGVKAVYASVISKPSVAVLKEHNIEVSFDTQVDAIRNRTNTGYCPIEQAVKDMDSPEDAPKAIREALAGLANDSHRQKECDE